VVSALAKALLPLGNLTAFAALACAGGAAGFVARRAGASAAASLAASVPAGFAAAYAVGALTSWLARETRYAQPLHLGATLGKVVARVGSRVTGEIVYVQDGARHALAARSSTGSDIETGTEVVVLEVKSGVATVVPSSAVFKEDSQ
jgi:hypothetical protein